MSSDPQQFCSRRTVVDITPLKEFALKLPDCALKDLVLADRNFLPADEFLIKVNVYLRLARRLRW